MKYSLLILATLLTLKTSAAPPKGEPPVITPSINRFGIELFQRNAPEDKNFCLSPYSLHLALSMTQEGAAGKTRDEMRQTLHLPGEVEDTAIQHHALLTDFNQRFLRELPPQLKGKTEPVSFHVVNHLFAQKSYALKAPFTEVCREYYLAGMSSKDFATQPNKERLSINQWVAQQTNQRIEDLLPAPSVTPNTRLILANALHFKAPWSYPFPDKNTQDRPFKLSSGQTVQTPMMRRDARLGYLSKGSWKAISMPFSQHKELQFVVVMPSSEKELQKLEKKLDTAFFTTLQNLPRRSLQLTIPRFKITTPSVPLKAPLIAMGLPRAFDQPRGSADFSNIESKRELYIDNVFHKCFVEIDEKGAEAAAATAVVMMRRTVAEQPTRPLPVIIDKPFLFLIQDTRTGTCLFLGKVVNPAE